MPEIAKAGPHRHRQPPSRGPQWSRRDPDGASRGPLVWCASPVPALDSEMVEHAAWPQGLRLPGPPEIHSRMGRTERAQDSVPGRSGLTCPGRPPGSASLQLTGPSPLPPLCGGSPRVSQIPAGRTHQPHISGRPFLSPLRPRGHTGVPGGAQRHAAPHPQREDLAGL